MYIYRLLRAAKEAEKSSGNYSSIVETIRLDHHAAAQAYISDNGKLTNLLAEIDAECETLLRILESAQHLEEVSSRVEDKIISKGEKLSCRFMAALLQDRNIGAQYVNLEHVAPHRGLKETGLDERFYLDLAASLGEEVYSCGTNVPVITGYFGDVPGGILHTIGRGYTDLCAALVAVGLRAEEFQVWKEVDGIFSADPRKVPTARLLPSVTPSEAAELTFYGSEVIHPFTMEQVIRARIPIRIKNVMNPRNKGTVIFPDSESIAELNPSAPLHDSKLFRTRSTSNVTMLRGPKRPTAVTIKRRIVVLNVHSNKRTRAHGFLMNIFSVLDRHHLSVDLISTSEVHVSMALHSESAMLSGGGEEEDYIIEDEDLRGAVEELMAFGTVDLVPNMAIVSLVGRQLKNMVGISGRFFSVLGENNINIEMISQGNFIPAYPPEGCIRLTTTQVRAKSTSRVSSKKGMPIGRLMLCIQIFSRSWSDAFTGLHSVARGIYKSHLVFLSYHRTLSANDFNSLHLHSRIRYEHVDFLIDLLRQM